MFQEADMTGLTWSDLGQPISANQELTMLHVWLMLLADVLLYLVILWYMDNVRPGTFGVAKKLYFPFQVDE